MQAFFALYKATAREFLRDRMALFITLFLPLLMAIFFGMIFADDPGVSLSVGLAVEDIGRAGEEFAAALADSALEGVVDVQRGTHEQVRSAVQQGRLAAALVLPENFSSQLTAGQPAALPIYYDPQQEQLSGPALLVVRQMIQEADLALQDIQPLLVLQEQPIGAHRIPMAHFYIPGMLALSVLWLGVFGTAPPLVELREQQILRRIGVTPLKRSTLLAAQIGWRFTTGILSAVLLIGFGMIAYGISAAGSWLLLVASFVLGVFVFVALGFLLASLARSTEGVVGMGQMVMFPMMFLSGIFIPLEVLPAFLQSVAAVIPLTYLGDSLQQTLLGAPGLHPLWVNFSVLGVWLAGLTALSMRCFRWE